MPQPRISIQPVCLQAAQPLPVADLALHVHLGRGLGEREERGPEPHLGGGREEPAGEVGQRRLEVHEGDPLVHRQPFDLEKAGVWEASAVSLR